jgi:broad specificity phosphatase PhoE
MSATRPPLQIYFVRHGETAWSLTGQHTGRTDLPLTPHGEAMARALAPALQDVPFSRVLSSPRLRARTTCQLAGFGPANVELAPDLAEWDYGDYEGLRTADIRKQHPAWDVWQDGCPNGETPAAVSARADRLIAGLISADHPNDLDGGNGPSRNIMAFSHGQFGRALAARWIGLPVMQGQHFAIGPASISILGFEADHPERRVIALWNATSGIKQGASR